MAKWKLFGKSKEEETAEAEEETSEETQETEDRPVAEYRETLESGKKSTSQTKTATTVAKKSETPADQRVWRDVDSIEGNVDNIHIRKAEKPVTDVDRKVDKLIEKSKRK